MNTTLDTEQKRLAMANRLNAISQEIAREVGAPFLAIVAVFNEKDMLNFNMIEGGTGNIDWLSVYQKLILAREMQNANGKKDFTLRRQ